MAIDTANKRANTLLGLPFPDGTIGAADRVQVTRNYAGISIASIAALVTWTLRPRVLSWTLRARNISWTLRERVLTWTLKERED